MLRLKPLALGLLLSMCAALPAHALIFTYTGNTTGALTFNRTLEDGSALSGVGTAVRYNSFLFTVSVSGQYTFLTTAPNYDPFVVLYRNSFNPAAPLANFVVANDDLLGFTTSGVSSALVTGTTYAFVNTGFGNTDFGQFSTTIGGPGVITQVPEPAAYLMLAAGLVAIGWSRRQRSA